MLDKDLIISELRRTGRPGIEEVIQYMERTDFFEAPASTKFHNNIPGGLARHSLQVFQIAEKINETILDFDFSIDSIRLCGLLHDFCKIEVYKINEDEKTKASEPYVHDDKFPIGHGDKSVLILTRLGLELKDEELLAIRYHMYNFDKGTDLRNVNSLAKLIYVADFIESQLFWVLDNKQKHKW